MTDAFSSDSCIRKSAQKLLHFVHRFEKSSWKILTTTLKMVLESCMRTQNAPNMMIYKNGLIIGNYKLTILRVRWLKWPKYAKNVDFWPFSGSQMT